MYGNFGQPQFGMSGKAMRPEAPGMNAPGMPVGYPAQPTAQFRQPTQPIQGMPPVAPIKATIQPVAPVIGNPQQQYARALLRR